MKWFKKEVAGVFASLAVLAIFFNNCSQGSAPVADTASEIATNSDPALTGTGNVCDDAMLSLYAHGYYKFVRSNCINCHAHDADKPQFASNDVMWGYQVFMDKGYQRVSANALSSAHQPPYTGAQHSATISELKTEFQKGIAEYNACKGEIAIVDTIDPKTLLTLELTKKAIPALAVDGEAKITWDLSNSVIKYTQEGVVPTLPNAKFSAKVARHKTAGGTDYYTIRSPTIFNSDVDIKVKIIYVKINDRLVDFPSTFKFIDTDIRKNSLEDSSGLVSTGALTAPRVITNNDSISFVFGTLESEVLPPPPPPIYANFAGADVEFIDSTSGTINVNVDVTGTLDVPATITLDINSTAQCGTSGEGPFTVNGTSCLPTVFTAMTNAGLGTDRHALKLARSIVGTSFNRFDWDYSYKGASVSLQGVNPSSSIAIKFSNDIRKEANDRILIVNLNSASSNILAGTKKVKYFVIKKQNNPDPSGEVTFAMLSKAPNGVFYKYCIKCHNSRDLNGNYDISSYESLTNRGGGMAQVIDLGLINESLLPAGSRTTSYPGTGENLQVLTPMQIVNLTRMAKRLDGAEANLTAMPIEGTLSAEIRAAVKDWFLAGAKNN